MSQRTSLSNAAPSASTASPAAALWSTLSERFPAWRNATRYYVRDVSKRSVELYQTAANAASNVTADPNAATNRHADPNANPGTSPGGSGSVTPRKNSPEPSDYETEVHYEPNPGESTGLAIRSYDFQTRADGSVYLLLSLDIGFAVFEVLNDGVFEKFVDLKPREMGATVGIWFAEDGDAAADSAEADESNHVAVDDHEDGDGDESKSGSWIVVFEQGMIRYKPQGKKKAQQQQKPKSAAASSDANDDMATNVSSATPTAATPSAAVVQQRLMFDESTAPVHTVRFHQRSNHCVLYTKEFDQLTIVNLETFSIDAPPLIGDRPVLSVCDRWLAYSCSPDTPVPTAFGGEKEISTTETVAKNVMSSISAIKRGIWGSSGAPLNAEENPLGSVVIYDLPTKSPFAAFTAHTHSLQCMNFDQSGTLLATASSVGTSIHIFQIHVVEKQSGEKLLTQGDVQFLFTLNRGVTSSTVTSIAFSPLNFWISVGTAVGTCHLFRVPDEERNSAFGSTAAKRKRRNNTNNSNQTATALTATARIRSAPSSTNPDPAVIFSSVPVSRRPEEMGVIIATSSGSLTRVTCTEAGARMSYGQHLPAFHGPRIVEEPTPAPADPDLVWRAGLELMPHPPFTRPKHFAFAVPSSETPGANEGTVDVCTDWDTA